MTPTQIDRVFGRGRLKMVTGEHVEVFREAVGPGERRRYTKRFLNTTDGNFAHWTEREWRILARLIGHGIDCVPDVVQFDRGSIDGAQLVQTYDAGATVDQWATLLPLHRSGRVYRHAFEDCAHWWALAHHSLVALKKIHQLELVHLDVKGDNVCIPIGPATFDPDASDGRLHPVFAQLALIDFAFALVSGEALAHPLPIGWQRDYDYQSPRLLKALEEGRNGDLRLTGQLDWRCDIYSLAAMLKRYLPDEDAVDRAARTGWNADRYDAAKALILSLREHHDRDVPHVLPHSTLIHTTSARLRERDLAHSLASGWTLARDVDVVPTGMSPLTPMTRLAPSIRVFVSPQAWMSGVATTADASREIAIPRIVPSRDDAPRANPRSAAATRPPIAAVVMIAFSLAIVAALVVFPDVSRAALNRAWAWAGNMLPHAATSVAEAEPPKTPTLPPSPATSEPERAAASMPKEAATPTEPATVKEAATPKEIATPKQAATPKEIATSKEVATPSASPAPVQHAPPIPSVTPPAFADARPPASGVAAQSTVRKATPSKVASAAVSKTKASATPSSATSATPRATATSKTPQRSASLAPAPHTPPSATRSFAISSLPASVTQLPAATKPEAQSATAIVTAPAPAIDRAAVAMPQQAARPARGATDPEPIVSAEIADTPTSPPPTPARERKNPSRIEKFIDQGWLSKLLRLGNSKPAPIEDRRLQGSPAKQPPMDPVDANPPAQLAQAEASPPKLPRVAPAPPPDKPTTGAWHAVELQERIPTPATQAMPDVGVDTDPADADLVFASEGRRALRDSVPRIATEAQSEVARVLWVAANATDSAQDREIVDAAQSMRIADRAQGFAQKIAPAEARRLNAEASDAYWTRRNNAETFDLQLKAFGANPYDAEVAGNFALMHLKVGRPQPETARQLALIAIAYRGARSRPGRFEDWTTFAIASALTGRNADARNAFFVTIALSGNIERTCRSALNALSNYGERLRDPVEAMLYRIHTQGRAHESSACLWPRRWAMSSATQ